MGAKRGPRTIHRLTSAKIKQAGPGKFADGGNLWLVKTSRSTGSWAYRYTFNGRAHELGLGSIITITATEAREEAKKLRKLQQQGINPLKDRRDKAALDRIEAAKSVTFKDFSEEFISLNSRKWSNPKHAKQWAATLDTYVNPLLGSLPIAAIDTEMVMRVLLRHVDGKPFWNSRAETARRVRSRVEQILDAAKAMGKREGENPARLKGHLENLLPSRSETEKGEDRHHAAVPFRELPTVMAALREREDLAAKALEFVILTGVRDKEMRIATWGEIDFPSRIWTVPASHTKTKKKAYKIPLPRRAIEILEAVKGDNPRDDSPIFPGLSDGALRRVLASIRPGYTVHGCRSSLKDWAREAATEYADEVSEIALGHKVGTKVWEAYARSDLFQRRVKFMNDWARHCEDERGTLLPFASVG